MPFNREEYARWCAQASNEQLQEDYNKYTRQVATGASATGIGLALSVFTLGVSLLGSAGGSAMAANAGIKRDIIKTELTSRDRVTLTRGSDIARGFSRGFGV